MAKPGPKGPHAGNWPKGVSGNPGGRPKAPIRFRELYHKADGDAKNYERLEYWASQKKNGTVALAAIKLMMERVYGLVSATNDEGETVDKTITVVVARPIFDTPSQPVQQTAQPIDLTNNIVYSSLPT